MIYLLILLGILIIGSIYSNKHPKFFAISFFHDSYGLSVHYLIILTTLCIIILMGAGVYINTISGVAEMEAFQNETLSVYEYVIDKSENITINTIKENKEEMKMLFNAGNLAYFELAKSVNTNLVDSRKSIRIYNARLYSYRRYNDFWFTDGFVYNVPLYLKPIKFE